MSGDERLTFDEHESLLTPCACGHTINDHGTLANCWRCDDENRACSVDFEALLTERVGVIVAARLAAATARADDLARRLGELADEWERRRDDYRERRPQSGRWIGRSVAYGAAATDLRAALDGGAAGGGVGE